MSDKIKGYADFISGQINELSKKTLGSYVKKNVDQQTDLTYQHGSDPEEYETNPENPQKIQKRRAGLDMAVKKLTKEESESIVNAFANFISKQEAIVNEAAKKGTERVSYHGGIIHKVLHSDKKTGDHLTMSYSEEPGSVYFHGRMNGKKIRVDSASDHGDQPTHQEFMNDLKKAHPDLPKETHEKIGKIAKKGLKELEYGED